MDTKGLQSYQDTSNKPSLPEGDIKAILAKVYGLHVMGHEELESYIDRNYHVSVSTNHRNEHVKEIPTRGYVLKILNSSDSSIPDVPVAQLQVMGYLKSNGINCPYPVKTMTGDIWHTWTVNRRHNDTQMNHLIDDNLTPTVDKRYVIFLCAFLDGDVMYKVPYLPSLSYSCGILAGKVDAALQNYGQPVPLLKYQSVWDLRSALNLLDLLHVVPNGDDATLVKEILQTFEQEVLSKQEILQKGVVHGDFSEHNIFVESSLRYETLADGTGIGYFASGIVDFGDTAVSYYVFEVSILICYMMIDSREEHLLDAGGHALAGYLKHMTLTDTEISLVRECAAARLAQSLVMGAYTYSLHQGNDYIITTSKRGWDCLRRFWSIPKEHLLRRWKGVIASHEKSAV